VISANPSLSAAEVISILKRTASKDLDFGDWPRTPPGPFDPNPTFDISPVAPFADGTFTDIGDPDGTWSPWYGHGRVDALAAVGEALGRVAPGPGAVQGFQGTEAPDRSIPDNSTRGIKSRIPCPDAFVVDTVAVNLNITHTFIGDLRVTLTSPDGTSVVLHDRSGGNQDDLVRSLDVTTTPALSALAGTAAQGEWTLHVADLARFDRGRLMSWSLDLSGRDAADAVGEDVAGTQIPDNAPGIERSLSLTGGGTVGEITVEMDIAHTFIGDLSVVLAAPGGQQVVLHNRTGGSSDNIIQTYTLANTPRLSALLGAGIDGDWTLSVRDHAAADRGKLNRWALSIRRA
jgi:subtilisin-like proprotein convertase family protein